MSKISGSSRFSQASSSPAVTQKNNTQVKAKLKKGDLVCFQRGLFKHWAVYVGLERVAHQQKDDRPLCKCGTTRRELVNDICQTCKLPIVNCHAICVDKIDDVAQDSWMAIDNNSDKYWSPSEPDRIVERAASKVGPATYDFLTDNCEHFATWCRYGEAFSWQSLQRGVKYAKDTVRKATCRQPQIGTDFPPKNKYY